MHFGLGTTSAFFNVTRTIDELSSIFESAAVPVALDRPLKAMRIKGQLDLDPVGISEQILEPLVAEAISVCAELRWMLDRSRSE